MQAREGGKWRRETFYFDEVNSGSRFGHILTDLQLAVGDGTVVHVDWDVSGDPAEQRRAKVVVVTEEAVIVALRDEEEKIDHMWHTATARSLRGLEDVSVSGSLPLKEQGAPGVVRAVLTWSDTSTITLPPSKSKRINESLKTLIPALIKGVTT